MKLLCTSKAAYRHYRETTEVVAKARCSRQFVHACSLSLNRPLTTIIIKIAEKDCGERIAESFSLEALTNTPSHAFGHHRKSMACFLHVAIRYPVSDRPWCRTSTARLPAVKCSCVREQRPFALGPGFQEARTRAWQRFCAFSPVPCVYAVRGDSEALHLHLPRPSACKAQQRWPVAELRRSVSLSIHVELLEADSEPEQAFGGCIRP